MYLTCPKNLAAADYTALKPCDLFIYESVPGDQAIGLVLPFDDEEYLRVLTLTGKDAFVVRDFERIYNHHVLPLQIDVTQLRLQIDHEDTSFCEPAHQLGRIVIGGHRQPVLQVSYRPDRSQASDRVVFLKDWTMGAMREPRFGFKRWALVYRDETDAWVPIIRTGVD